MRFTPKPMAWRHCWRFRVPEEGPNFQALPEEQGGLYQIRFEQICCKGASIQLALFHVEHFYRIRPY